MDFLTSLGSGAEVALRIVFVTASVVAGGWLASIALIAYATRLGQRKRAVARTYTTRRGL